MAFKFEKANKLQSRLRMALIGISGSGKTYTALTIACGLSSKVAVIDTEHGSASKYADLFDFDTVSLQSFSPLTYVDAIKSAELAGYEVIIIDSMSHAWNGKDGALEQVDIAARKMKTSNTYVAWRDVTPMQNSLIDTIIASKCHIIATMRAKNDSSLEKDSNGKTIVRKIGLAAIQRDGVEYEFDVIGEMTQDNEMIITKSRCPTLSGQIINRPGNDLTREIQTWLTTGIKLPTEEELLLAQRELHHERCKKLFRRFFEKYQTPESTLMQYLQRKDYDDVLLSDLQHLKQIGIDLEENKMKIEQAFIRPELEDKESIEDNKEDISIDQGAIDLYKKNQLSQSAAM